MSEAGKEEFTSNFRVRVAREKRERMRNRLLQATMSLCADRKSVGALVIDDIVQEARVSRGTFYKYFDSVDEVVEDLEKRLVSELADSLRDLVKDEKDPGARICIGVCALLIRAHIDPAWGGFVSQTVYASSASTMIDEMRKATEAGREAGLFAYDNLDVAVDFNLGLTLQAMRRVRQPTFDTAYILGVASLALSGLGADRAKADEMARDALRRLVSMAPARLKWWPTKLPDALAQIKRESAHNPRQAR